MVTLSDVFVFSNVSIYTTVVQTRKTSLKGFVSYYGTMVVLIRNVKFLLTCTVYNSFHIKCRIFLLKIVTKDMFACGMLAALVFRLSAFKGVYLHVLGCFWLWYTVFMWCSSWQQTKAICVKFDPSTEQNSHSVYMFGTGVTLHLRRTWRQRPMPSLWFISLPHC